MKCQICGKENATIHIREIKDGEKRSYYICKECASAKGGTADIMGLAKIISELTSSLSKLSGASKGKKELAKEPDLSGLLQGAELEMLQDLFGTQEKEESSPDKDKAQEECSCGEEKLLRCPSCGWGTEQLKKTGRLGCPECYKVFGCLLEASLKKMHRGTLHAGKYPANLDRTLAQEVENAREMSILVREKNRELYRLQSELESAVKQEEYEKAALLRDRISSLLPQMDGNFFSPQGKGSSSGTSPENP